MLVCWYVQVLKEHEPKNEELYKELEKELAEVKAKKASASHGQEGEKLSFSPDAEAAQEANKGAQEANNPKSARTETGEYDTHAHARTMLFFKRV